LHPQTEGNTADGLEKKLKNFSQKIWKLQKASLTLHSETSPKEGKKKRRKIFA
jgi:hypothetical protein